MFVLNVILDLDIDSQTDGANAVMSGLDSESESDIADPDAEDEFPESQYTHSYEEEFGAVNYICFFFSYFVITKWKFVFIRLVNKLKN